MEKARLGTILNLESLVESQILLPHCIINDILSEIKRLVRVMTRYSFEPQGILLFVALIMVIRYFRCIVLCVPNSLSSRLLACPGMLVVEGKRNRGTIYPAQPDVFRAF